MVAAAARYSGGGGVADGVYSELFEGVGMGSEAEACAPPGTGRHVHAMCTPCAACMPYVCVSMHMYVRACACVHACARCAALDLGLSGAAEGWSATGRTWVLDPIDGTKGFLRGDQ